MSLLKIICVGVSVIMLGQHSLAMRASPCSCTLKNHPRSVQPGVSQEIVNSLNMLNDGLEAHLRYLPRLLPQRLNVTEDYDMLKSLTVLSEHEEQLKSLVRRTGAKNDPELVALRVVFKSLVDNTCSLFKEAYGLDKCSYEVLKKLQLIVKAKEVSEKSRIAVRNRITAPTGGSQLERWTRNVLMCSLSDEEFALVRTAEWPFVCPLNRDCC